MATLDDYVWLTGAEAEPWIGQAAADKAPLHQRIERLRKEIGLERSGLVVGQADLRERARSKFGRLAQRMFFTTTLLAEATDIWIAGYVAAQYSMVRHDRKDLDDFCCGLGGNLGAFAQAWPGPIHAWDNSPIARLLAEANVRSAAPQSADRLIFHVGDASDAAPQGVWHADPERRQSGRRTTRVADYSPGLEALERWRTTSQHGAVKLAPGADPPSSWESEMEWEWISRARECRQLIAWGGDLARRPGERRATRIVGASDGPTWEAIDFVGRSSCVAPTASEPGAFVIDPDPAVVAARLTSAMAVEYGLRTLGPAAIYLTGDAPPNHRLLASFAVDAVLPMRASAVTDALRARRIGQVEVKTRGVDVDSRDFLRKLKLQGDQAATLFLTRIGERRVAIIAARVAAESRTPEQAKNAKG